MRIEQLNLTNFRNLSELELKPCRTVNIIYGDNAQGKTNLIESLWLLTGAKSFRGSKDADIPFFDKEFAKIKVQFQKEGRLQTAEIQYAAKKTAFLNEIPLSSATALAGIFCAVVFSPIHLSLIQDGPSARRRFIDTCICQISPRFIRLTAEYNHTLLQRNSLLKDISYSADLLDTLDVWDRKLAELAARIVQNRKGYLQKLSVYAAQSYCGIAANKEQLSMQYLPGGGICENVPVHEYQNWFLQALQKTRAEDLRCGTTSIGPHRDDIEFKIDEISVRSFGSQGQQRSCVLALKLAESKLMSELLHDEPVILLDDVMSELDNNRQEYLLNHLDENQVFITGCDKSAFHFMQNGATFRMKRGSLYEERVV